jgi:hypothetical protein
MGIAAFGMLLASHARGTTAGKDAGLSWPRFPPDCPAYLQMDLGNLMPISFDSPLVLLVLGMIQLFGLVSATIARLGEGSRCQTLCQRVFLVCLGLVGAATAVSVGLLAPGAWVACGATLALMVLMATCEFGRTSQATAW